MTAGGGPTVELGCGTPGAALVRYCYGRLLALHPTKAGREAAHQMEAAAWVSMSCTTGRMGAGGGGSMGSSLRASDSSLTSTARIGCRPCFACKQASSPAGSPGSCRSPCWWSSTFRCQRRSPCRGTHLQGGAGEAAAATARVSAPVKAGRVAGPSPHHEREHGPSQLTPNFQAAQSSIHVDLDVVVLQRCGGGARVGGLG